MLEQMNIREVARAAEAATAVISVHVYQTPLLRSPELDRITGGRLFLKAECLQRAGSFKFRGAINAISRLTALERRRGVVAFSSGNHAVAVSLAAAQFGTPALIILPRDVPKAKSRLARNAGARILFYDRQGEDREAIARRYVLDDGMSLIPPFDDVRVIVGAATGAVEAVVQLDGVRPDLVLMPCSGGGLAAGWSSVLRTRFPTVELVVVEPEGFDDTGRSLQAGRVLENVLRSGSICDALLAPRPGEIPFTLLSAARVRGVAVSDADVLAATNWCFERVKVCCEPAGAAALAAVLAGKVNMKGKQVLLPLSGGNVDPEVFARALGVRLELAD